MSSGKCRKEKNGRKLELLHKGMHAPRDLEYSKRYVRSQNIIENEQQKTPTNPLTHQPIKKKRKMHL